MKMNFPTGIAKTLGHLTYAVKRLEETSQPRIDDALRQDLIQGLAVLSQAKEAYEQAIQDRRVAALARNRNGSAMIYLVRDFYQNLKRGARRDANAQEWQRLYPPAAEMPKTTTVDPQWYSLATRITAAQALAKGRQLLAPPPANPSVEEIAASLEVALVTEQGYREAQLALKARAAALQQAYKDGARLLRWLLAQLRQLSHQQSAEARRDLLRSFGMKFVTIGEDDEDAVEPPDDDQKGAVA